MIGQVGQGAAQVGQGAAQVGQCAAQVGQGADQVGQGVVSPVAGQDQGLPLHQLPYKLSGVQTMIS